MSITMTYVNPSMIFPPILSSARKKSRKSATPLLNHMILYHLWKSHTHK